MPGILPLLGQFAQTPAGGMLLSELGSYGANRLKNYIYGEQPLSPSQQAQQHLLRQLQQPGQFQPIGFQPIANEATRQFEQDIIPGLAERFSGMGGQRSSAFQQSLGQAGGDLASRLAALGSQHAVGQQQAGMQQQGLNQQLLGQLAQFLQGQGQLGLGQQQLGQQQRQTALSALGNIGNFGLGQSSGELSRLTGAGQSAAQAYQQAQTGQFTPIQTPGQPGQLNNLLNAGAQATQGLARGAGWMA